MKPGESHWALVWSDGSFGVVSFADTAADAIAWAVEHIGERPDAVIRFGRTESGDLFSAIFEVRDGAAVLPSPNPDRLTSTNAPKGTS